MNKKAYLSDFRNFLYLVWKHLNLDDPTPVQYDMAHYLQHGPERGVIEAYRGAGKSWITSALVLWLLLNNPQLRILVVSASKSRSDDFTTFTKRLIYEMDILTHLRPRKGGRDSNVAFDVGPAEAAHAPSVKSVGITGQIAGSRADIIIADDIETPKNSLTQLQRDRLAEAIKEFDAVLTPKTTSRIIYLGTPQTEMSIYNRLPERGYKMRVWTARVPANPDSYGSTLAPFIHKMIEDGAKARTPVDPKRFDEFDLLKREASYGRSGFALQFMLDTTLSDAERYPLKLADLLVMNVDKKLAPINLAWGGSPENLIEDLESVGFTGDKYYRPFYVDKTWAEYQGAVMFIDPSGRGKDQTGYAVVKLLHGMLFVTAWGGLDGGYDDLTLNKLAVIATTNSVDKILIEPNFGDGMFTKLFKPVCLKKHACTIEDAPRASTQKERRIIDVLEPVMNQHKLIMDRAIIESDLRASDPKHSGFYQMTRLTKEAGALQADDQIDALAGAVAYWVEQMALDVEDSAQSYEDHLRDIELQKFMEAALGQKPKAPNWMNN